MFFVGLPGPTIDDTAGKILQEISPGGVCLFARNIREARQTRELLDEIRSALPVEPFLSIDQEGGLVDRLRRIMTPMPAAGAIRNAAHARKLGGIIGEALRILGFNMDFAPVVDVIDETRAKFSNGLYSRAFGDSAETAANLAGEFLDAMQQQGVLGCLKHFPGLGSSEVDSHDELPNVNIEQDEFEEVDLIPYRALLAEKNIAAVMTAHAAYPKLNLQQTDGSGKLLPASLSSRFLIKLLRGELQFNGLALTDDLEMGAILKNYGIGEACTRAVLAGEDMLLICAGVDVIYEGFEAVRNAVERNEISMARIDESITRITNAKSILSPPLPYNFSRLDEISRGIEQFNNDLQGGKSFA